MQYTISSSRSHLAPTYMNSPWSRSSFMSDRSRVRTWDMGVGEGSLNFVFDRIGAEEVGMNWEKRERWHEGVSYCATEIRSKKLRELLLLSLSLMFSCPHLYPGHPLLWCWGWYFGWYRRWLWCYWSMHLIYCRIFNLLRRCASEIRSKRPLPLKVGRT